MKTIIAGSRNIQCYSCLVKAVELAKVLKEIEISEVISGGAKGVDTLAIQYAKKNHIKYQIYIADWNKYGKKAGFLRNTEMANNSDALIAVWDGVSKGTKHMIDIAQKQGLKTFIYKIKAPSTSPSLNLSFSDFQKKSIDTLVAFNVKNKTKELELARLTLGLSGESGEVAEKVKKFLRDTNQTEEDYKQLATVLKKELGDILWYVSTVAHTLGLNLQEIADENIIKLALRKNKGTLHGEGDNR